MFWTGLFSYHYVPHKVKGIKVLGIQHDFQMIFRYNTVCIQKAVFEEKTNLPVSLAWSTKMGFYSNTNKQNPKTYLETTNLTMQWKTVYKIHKIKQLYKIEMIKLLL